MVWFHDCLLVLVSGQQLPSPTVFRAYSGWPLRYAFPPLLSDVIAKDMHFTKQQIANSNIVALVAT